MSNYKTSLANYKPDPSTGKTYASIVKKADETVNNSTTLQDDDELKFTAQTNKTYRFELRLRNVMPSTEHLKFAFSGPSGATGKSITNAWNGSAESNYADIFSAQAISTAGTEKSMVTTGHIIITTAGEVVFQWAQNVQGAVNTILKEGSSLTVWEENA